MTKVTISGLERGLRPRLSLETLRLRFSSFPANRERQEVRHVIRALPSGLRFVVNVCTARPRSSGK